MPFTYATRLVKRALFQEKTETVPSLFIETLFYPLDYSLDFKQAFSNMLTGGVANYSFKDWIYFYLTIHRKLVETLDLLYGETPYIDPQKDLIPFYQILRFTHRYLGKNKAKGVPYFGFDKFPTISGDAKVIREEWLSERNSYITQLGLLQDTHQLYIGKEIGFPLRLRYILDDVDRLLTEIQDKRNKLPKTNVMKKIVVSSTLPESVKLTGKKLVVGDKALVFQGLRYKVIKYLFAQNGALVPIRRVANEIDRKSDHTRVIIDQINKRLMSLTMKPNLYIDHDGLGNYHLTTSSKP